MPRRSRRSGNLPAEVTSFVGRRGELAEARRALATARLVTLVGPGGVGKTRMAVRLAAELGRGLADGAWLVELGELRDGALVPTAALAALDLRDQAGAEPEALLLAHVADRHLLLVVDNCEHLLDAAARLVHDVIRTAPGVRVLATSRQPLSVAGEHVLPVPPLRLPPPLAGAPLAQVRAAEAVSLFVERAAAASGGFELTDANLSAVADLCRRLDGLPLAIELAAIRTRALSPEQIRDRLSCRFELLTGGSRTALARHQTLLAAIEWSCDLLAPAERRLLSRLAVFAGRFRLDDVEAVCCGDGVPAAQALDLLSALLDRSLVMKEEAGGVACYRLHESMREFARRALRAAGEEAAVEQRCRAHYLARCLRFAAEGRTRLVEWLAWMDVEADTVRAVLGACAGQADPGEAIDLATCLIWYWVTRGTTEGVRWLDPLLARDPAPGTHPWAYFVRGFLAVLQSDPGAAGPALERAVAAARGAGPPDALAQSLAMASIAATMAGDLAAAARLLDEAREVARGLDDPGATLMVHQARALTALHIGDLATAGSAAAEGADLSRRAGDLYSLGMMLMNQGFAALLAGDVDQAGRRCAEGLRVAHQVDDRVAQCHLLGALAACAAAAREPQRAARLLGAMERLRAQAGASLNAGMAPAFTRAATAARAALGGPRFAELHAEGQHLDRHAAVRLALRKADPPPPRTAAGGGGAGGLRPREVDVARLVAEGLSNREIGARLFISERTVESHVRNILSRLGFQSRTQIAGWMAAPDR